MNEPDFNDPEYDSIEAFAEYLLDDEREEFTHLDLGCLNRRLGIPTRTIRVALEDFGFRLKIREKERSIRGFTANSHDRWAGNPCAGGSGWEQIPGFAGHQG